MSIGFQIRWARESKKWKQEDLAKRTGINQARISNYENDVREPTRKNLQKIADALGKPIEFFYKEVELKIKEKSVGYKTALPSQFNIPIVGHVDAERPVLMEENIEGYLELRGDFALKVLNHCMSPTISNGDIIVVRQQSTANNGDIVIAVADGEQTLKRFYKKGAQITLKPDNPNYKPIQPKKVKIIGKVVKCIKSC